MVSNSAVDKKLVDIYDRFSTEGFRRIVKSSSVNIIELFSLSRQ